MFDWNSQDQEGNTIWDEFTEAEDHIVPYPNCAEDNLLQGFGDYSKKQKIEGTSIDIETSEHKSKDKNDFSGSIQEKEISYDTAKLSAARLDMGSWPDLPSLNVAFGEKYSDSNIQDSMTTELIDDFGRSPNLNKIRVQLDTEPETSINDREDVEDDNFLDCSWANIGDFDDFEMIFNNDDSIFGHETVGNSGELLPTTSDLISNTAQSIPLPDMPSTRSQTCHHYSSPLSVCEPFKKQMGKTTEKPITYGEQSGCISHEVTKHQGAQTKSFEKSDTYKSQLKSCKKPGERNNAYQYFNCAYINNGHEFQRLPSSSPHAFTRNHFQTCQTPESSQQSQIDLCNDSGQIGSSSSFMFSGHGYTLYPLPVVPVFQHVIADSNQAKHVSFGYEAGSDSVRHLKSVDKPPSVPSRPTMTPQGKIEKLRRRQQMQALVAIQQQQQQFQHQITAYDTSVPQTNSPRNKTEESITNNTVEDLKHSSLELNTLVVHDESQIITSVCNDHAMMESAYYQLQDTLTKLNSRIRLCIRDSLFRLSQSATERQSSSDRNVARQCNLDEEIPICDETKRPSRFAKSQDAEKGTNPIDRAVAHLLFHRPSESVAGHVKEEVE